MKLSELEATFIGKFQKVAEEPGKSEIVSYCEIASVDGAQGVLFICPKCQNHSVLICFSNPRNAPVIPSDAFPRNDKRWSFEGETIDVLTLSPSVDLSQITPENPAHASRCYWHGFVKNGNAE